MSYPSQKRRLRPARGVAAVVAALLAGGAGLAAMPFAQAISPTGVAGTIQTMGGTTIAYQQGGYGPEDKPANQSQFSNPRGLAIAPNGDVYVTDALNQRVRVIDAAGIVHLVAGSGNQTAAGVTDLGNGPSATASTVTMNEPHGVAVSTDNTKIYIADSSNCVIRMVDKATNAISTIAGKGEKNALDKCKGDDVEGSSLASNIDTPKQIQVIKQNGVDMLYITDTGNNEIRKVDVGNPGGVSAFRITRVAGNSQAKKYGGDGGRALDANLRHAEGVWVANDGTVFLTDGGNNLVRKIDTNGIITTIAGDVAYAQANAGGAGQSSPNQLPGDDSGDGGPAAAAHLNGPRGIAGDNNGHLFIAEETGARIRRINLNANPPTIDTIGGDGQSSASGNGQSAIKGENGPALGTQFNFLHDITFNPADGSLWIADSKNSRVRSIVDAANAPGANVPTVTTTPTQPGNGGGTQVPGGKSGYWMLGEDGKVFAFGDARNATFGDAVGRIPAGAKAVHIEPTPSFGGYWINDDKGNVYGFGNAPFLGGVDGLLAGEKLTSLSSTPSGNGYWLFTSKGRVFPKGDAQKFGDLADKTLNGAIQSSVPTPTGKGYYMVGSDGGVFAFGDAKFFGSTGSMKLNKPVLSLVPTRTSQGYWLVASDGGIFAFGDAKFNGSMGDKKLNKPVVGMVRYGTGYLMTAADGGIFDFSGSPNGFKGSLGDAPPARPIVFAATLES